MIVGVAKRPRELVSLPHRSLVVRFTVRYVGCASDVVMR
jgi:hypothetical protein